MKSLTPVHDPSQRGSNCKGTPYLNSAQTQSSGNISNENNCALFITGIPVAIPFSEIFDEITDGAVRALSVKPPGTFNTSAAKLVFFSPQGAQSFFSRAHAGTGISLRESTLNVTYNRGGYLQYCPDNIAIRVLFLEGPSNIMTWQYWKPFFDQACSYQLDRWIMHPCSNPNRRGMEVRFVRVDGQAQACFQIIVKDKTNKDWIDILVGYGLDPCESAAWRP